MNFTELTNAVFSIVHENDPHRESKRLQLRNWCFTFFILFKEDAPIRLPFALSVLSNEKCWERTESIHRIKLNRRKVAKMLVCLPSWNGRPNPFQAIERFRIASWCCLEEDAILAFEQCKREFETTNDSVTSLKEFVQILSTSSIYADRLTEYWSHVISGYTSDLQLQGKHLYEHGLYLAVHRMDRKVKQIDDEETELSKRNHRGYLEAVEFFWNKIESLPENEFRIDRAFEVFINATLRAAMMDSVNNPDIFEFCFSQLSLELCPEFMSRVSSGSFSAVTRVQTYRPDLVPKIFNSLHVLVQMDYLKPVWAVLEKATTDQLRTYLNTDHCNRIYEILVNRGEKDRIIQFISQFSYKIYV